MCDSNHLSSFCVKQNVHMRFLNQNGRQLRLLCVRGHTDTLGGHMFVWQRPGARHEVGAAAPPTLL